MTGAGPIVVYCPAAAPGALSRTGSADYSYCFVLQRFRPVLEQLGPVTEVHDLAELTAALAVSARTPIVLSLAPVHQAPVGCGAPVVPLFAWEFDSLPYWRDGDTDTNWSAVLQQSAAAITLSHHTAEVVADAGVSTPVRAIPAPLAERFPQPADHLSTQQLTITGGVVDSRKTEPDRIPPAPEWDRTQIQLDFSGGSLDTGRLVGFHRPEEWGVWSASAELRIILPVAVSGPVRLTFHMVGLGPNAGRRITVSLGDATGSITLPVTDGPAPVSLTVRRSSRVLTLSGVIPTPSPTAHDTRRLGLRLTSLAVTPRRSWRPRRPAAASPQAERTVSLPGIVYTSVFNPADGRKNWQTMVTAFCHALQDEPGATLVLKMTHRSSAAFLGSLLTILRECRPFQCRVIALHGHMTDQEMASLAAATDFYVNTSTGEGLCMPLLEFMSLGVPALAPRHTAMAEYLDDSNSFPIDWSTYPTCWPQDPSRRWRTHQCRVHWDSVVAAYRRSYAVACDEPRRYAAMRESARVTIADFCNDTRVARLMADVLEVVGAR